MTSTMQLGIGVTVWIAGRSWTVQSFDGGTVVLISADEVMRVQIGELARIARLMESDPGSDPASAVPVGIMLTSLKPRKLRKLEKRAAYLRELGAVPASERAPACQKTAAKLGVSVRTVQRWLAAYETAGIAGLVDSRILGRTRRGVHPLWDEACLAELRQYTNRSTPSKGSIIDSTAIRLENEHGPGAIRLPSQATAYRRVAELSKGKYSFGSAKARRSVANRPGTPYGRLRATRPGEYVVLDTNDLDVFAMEPVTLRWVRVNLTVAMDLYSRCILGLRLSPISTKSVDVTNVLFQCVSPQTAAEGGIWPFHGVPGTVLVGHEDISPVKVWHTGDLLACMPETVVYDRGPQYMAAHVLGACQRFGINVQPAIPYKPTDKAALERFFLTLRQGLLQHLPAYKGPDIASRGADVEGEAFYYVSELEQIIREWVGSVYHRSRHSGLCVPECAGVKLSPSEAFEIGVAAAGGVTLPTSPDLAYEFLDVQWRHITHEGVSIDNRLYDGPGIGDYRDTLSPYKGNYAGKWPIFVDVHDIRQVYFRDPDPGLSQSAKPLWHTLTWEHAAALHQPFSKDAAEYVKRVSLRENRFVEPRQAVRELLEQWSRGQVETRRDRSLARRLSAQRATYVTAPEDTGGSQERRERASAPGVADLLAERDARAAQVEAADDLDVFAQYYIEHPDSDGLEVLD
ncbi:helix-turn-helix domain-containing protein [Nocardia sp. X0981]